MSMRIYFWRKKYEIEDMKLHICNLNNLTYGMKTEVEKISDQHWLVPSKFNLKI